MTKQNFGLVGNAKEQLVKHFAHKSPLPLRERARERGAMVERRFIVDLRQNMTDAERLLWRHLRAHRLGGAKFRRQQPIGPYIVDFVHFGARLVVEADGGQHNDSDTDAIRDAWLMSQGFRVLRFWNNEIIENTAAVLDAVMAAVESAQPLARRDSQPEAAPEIEQKGSGANA